MEARYETRNWKNQVITKQFIADGESDAIGYAIREAASRGEMVKLINLDAQWARDISDDGSVGKFYDTFHDPKLHA